MSSINKETTLQTHVAVGIVSSLPRVSSCLDLEVIHIYEPGD